MIYVVDFLSFFFGSLFSLWWLILPSMLAFMLWDKHFTTARFNFNSSLEWVFLEVQIPGQVMRSAKAMEEVFNSLHAPYRSGNWYRRQVMAFVPPFYVFELIGHNGTLRFYIRCMQPLKDFVKSRVYSQYPEAKVEEVVDPLKDLPEKLPNPTHDLFGVELRLIKNSAYPIKTYEVWDKLPEEQRIDSVSTLSEGAAQLTDQEWLIVQIFVMPVFDDERWGGKWITQGQKIIDELIQRQKPEEEKPLEAIWEFIVNLLLAPFRPPVWKETEKKERQWPTMMQHLTPGERERVEMVERKISKLGFWSVVRFAYIGKKDVFNKNMPKNSGALFGFFRIFAGQNSFDRNLRTFTSLDIPTHMYEERLMYRKKLLYAHMRPRWRTYETDFYVLNGEELASLYHPPLTFVPAPGIERRIVTEKAPPPDIPLPEP